MAIASTTSIIGEVKDRETRRIPSTMRAAVYRGLNDVRLEEVPVPEIGAGEILVRVHTCGICGTDLKKISSGYIPLRGFSVTRLQAWSRLSAREWRNTAWEIE